MLPHFFISSCDGSLHDTRAPDWASKPLRVGYQHTHSRIRSGRELRATLRAGGFAWPGGYPLALFCDDGGILCFDCGRTELRQIIRSIRDNSRDGWRVIGCNVLWEGPPETCAHCGKSIPTAYGPDDAGEGAAE